MASLTQRVIGRMAAILFLGSGVASIVLPSPGATSRPGQIAVGVGAIGIGLGAWFAPWDRWPRRATLVLAPLAFALLASSVLLGTYNRSTYAMYILLVFVWLGVSHRRGTALAFAPLAGGAYAVPLVITHHGDPLTSVWEVVVVSVLVGEGLSWMSGRLARAEVLDSARMWEMQQLLQAAERLAREQDALHVRELVATLGQQLLRADGTVVLLRDEPGGFVVAGDARWPAALQGARLDLADAPAVGQAVDEDRPSMVPAAEVPVLLGGTSYGTALVLPLRGSIAIQGIMVGGFAKAGGRLERFHEHIARTFATQAALALERVEAVQTLLDDSLHDELTGLANRRSANRALARTQPGDAVVMIDLDGFKELNDTRGHAAGDHLLRAFAGQLTDALREGDVAARLGGDEFLLLLRGAGANASVMLERLAARWHETGPPVTFSAGVAIVMPGDDRAGTLRSADQALYAAKRAGRDRITTAPREGAGV